MLLRVLRVGSIHHVRFLWHLISGSLRSKSRSSILSTPVVKIVILIKRLLLLLLWLILTLSLLRHTLTVLSLSSSSSHISELLSTRLNNFIVYPPRSVTSLNSCRSFMIWYIIVLLLVLTILHLLKLVYLLVLLVVLSELLLSRSNSKGGKET